MHARSSPVSAAVALIAAAHLAGQDPWEPVRWQGTMAQPASMPYDAARGRSILLGATVNGALLAEATRTAEWDGANWSEHTSATAPPPRFWPAAAYDLARRRVVLFGGNTTIFASRPVDETWEWDGANWTQRMPALRPPARQAAGTTYDALRQRVVLFGGEDATLAALADTWEWDGSNWTQRALSGPSARADAGMTFDAVRGLVVLHGGRAGATARDDTWTFDGLAWTVQPVAVRPPASATGIAYDSVRQRVVLPFAGTATWEWDGAVWQNVGAHPFGAGRNGASVGFDPVAGRVLVHGGDAAAFGTPRVHSDLHAWDGSSWQRVHDDLGLTLEGCWAAAYDRQRRSVVLAGDTTVLESAGATWRRVVGTPSPPRFDWAVAHDDVRGRTVGFGGMRFGPPLPALADTLEWDGVSWQSRVLPNAPPARAEHAMAFDLAGGGVLLFGGVTNGGLADDTWRFDGTQWQQLAPAVRPGARRGPAMATDRVRARIVLFGGGDDETWEWDGATWTQAQPAVRPPARSHAAIAFDEGAARMVLFGGKTPSNVRLGDTWLFDGATWTQVPGSTARIQEAPRLVYDGALDRVLLVDAPRVLRLALTPAAATTSFGQGCAGTAPGLVLRGDQPYLDNRACSLELTGPVPGGACLFALSATTQQTPLGGCTLYLGPGEVRFAVANVFGVARLPLPVPPLPVLRGLSVYAQGAQLDPLGPFGGLSFSAGWQLTVGD